MAKNQESPTVITPKFRAAFVSVFSTTQTPNGQDRYQLTGLFEPGEDLSALKKLAKKALEDKWGTDPKQHPKGLRSPFRKQSEKSGQYEGFADDDDAIFINMATIQQPGIVDENLKDIIDPKQFYSGCYARAEINAYAYDKKGNKGVAFGLNNIQKLEDGERLGGGGRSNASSVFESAETGGEDASSLFD